MSTAERLTRALNKLVALGLLSAEVSASGEYAYRVTDEGLAYHQLAPSDDPVFILIDKLMQAAVNG